MLPVGSIVATNSLDEAKVGGYWCISWELPCPAALGRRPGVPTFMVFPTWIEGDGTFRTSWSMYSKVFLGGGNRVTRMVA